MAEPGCAQEMGPWRCEKRWGHRGAHISHTDKGAQIKWWTTRRPFWAALR